MLSSLLIGALIGPSVGATGSSVPVPSDPSASLVSAPIERTDEALLRQRIADRWQALIKGDFEAAYQFETPAYRAVYTSLQFKYQFGNQIAWRVANVKDVRYDDSNVARVTVSVSYHYDEPEKKEYRPLNTTAQINEIWLRKDGQWWHQQD
jgi:hypothetical protein